MFNISDLKQKLLSISNDLDTLADYISNVEKMENQAKSDSETSQKISKDFLQKEIEINKKVKQLQQERQELEKEKTLVTDKDNQNRVVAIKLEEMKKQLENKKIDVAKLELRENEIKIKEKELEVKIAENKAEVEEQMKFIRSQSAKLKDKKIILDNKEKKLEADRAKIQKYLG